MKPPSLTIGIEEEYQIIDPQTRELKSYITQILEDSKLILKEQVKAELHQSMVEVGSEGCRDPAEARAPPAHGRRRHRGAPHPRRSPGRADPPPPRDHDARRPQRAEDRRGRHP